jgi:small-conductance mechanosensitive channel
MEQFLEFLNYSFPVYGRDYTFGQIIVVPVVALFGFMLVRRIGTLLQRRLTALEFDRDLILLSQRLYFIAAYFGLFLILLSLLQIPLTAFAFISGAVAIGVGFGAQNIINNFISGWILMWERPIRIGDFLEIGDVRGTVETINTRSTRIRRVDGVHLLVPNSQLLENTVVNWTLIDKLARAVVRVGVAYGSPVRKVEELILKSAMEHADIIHAPEPVVFFEDFGDSALIFDLYFWINAFGEKDLRRIKSDIRFRIDELFAEAGIVIAYPQQDVHLDGKLELVRRPRS